MKQICKIDDDFYFEHDQNEIVLISTQYYDDYDEKKFEDKVNFCGICGFHPETNKPLLIKEI